MRRVSVPDASDAERTERIYADGIAMVRLLGPQDRLLRMLERQHPSVQVLVRGNEITLTGAEADVAAAKTLVDELIAMTSAGHDLVPSDVENSARMLRRDEGPRPSEVLGEAILSTRGRVIRPKTLGQKEYVDAIEENTIVFGIGPAGTGKTYLAMAKAVQALQRKEVNRIILTRPAVEAGERLGFLPGTLTDKIDPYLRPLYDALNEMMDPELVPRLMAAGTIEVAPLAYMRGRTLNDSFVVLDEAQNTTPEQMKMFLTRLGFGTRGCAWSPACCRTSTTSTSPGSPATTWCATRWSGASSMRTASTTSSAPLPVTNVSRRTSSRTAPTAAADNAGDRETGCRSEDCHDRDQQRVGHRGRRDRAAAGDRVQPRPAACQPGCRGRDRPRRRRRHGVAARAVDG
jgi:phosphate starvation-inducible PhoH-like protein